jgi:DNA-directed RNA polymerase subunit RPC12/RpoP
MKIIQASKVYRKVCAYCHKPFNFKLDEIETDPIKSIACPHCGTKNAVDGTEPSI